MTARGQIMKRYLLCVTGIVLMLVTTGCAKKAVHKGFQSGDHKILYDLLVERCKAFNTADMKRIRELYAKDSPELEWLSLHMPHYHTMGVRNTVLEVRKISVVGMDAAGSFVVRVTPARRSPFRQVEVLYVKEGSQWKIESIVDIF
jgi:hypothetical protein